MIFDVSTQWKSDTYYSFSKKQMNVFLEDTKHLTEEKYRALYPSDKCYLDTAFYLKDLKNVTIDFGGATLLLHNDGIQPFVLDNCENVIIQNVTVEYQRSLLDEIDIVEVKDGEIWLKQTEKQKKYFPVKAEDGLLIPVSGDKEYRQAFTAPHFFSLYCPENRECCGMPLIRMGGDLQKISKEAFPFQYYELRADEREGCIVLSGDVPPNIRAGLTTAQTHSGRDISSCFIICSKNIQLKNYRILNGAGMGILGMYSKNITLDGLRLYFDEQSHGISTNAADAVHLIACFGEINILNSVLEGMKDDAVNIHGNYYIVESASGHVIEAYLGSEKQANPAVNAHYKMLDDNDIIQIYENTTMTEKATLTVRKIEITDTYKVKIHVDGNVQNVNAGDTVENISAQANVTFRNCRFGKAVTHLRLQSRGDILMEDCESSLEILLSGDKNYWYESSPIRNLAIKNCRFMGEKGKIVAAPEYMVTPEAPFYHSGIRVINNMFDTTMPMRLSGCDDIVFEGNVNSRKLPFVNEFIGCGKIALS